MQFRLNISEIDPMHSTPAVFGILLSDLLDHIAADYAGVSNRDERDIRVSILKIMRDEDRFKEKDPCRGSSRGVTIMPKPI